MYVGMYVCVYINIYMYTRVCVCVYVYIYIYRERERDICLRSYDCVNIKDMSCLQTKPTCVAPRSASDKQ